MIVYQDTTSPRPETSRMPAPLVGAVTFTRRDCADGDLVTLGEPLGDLVPPGAGVEPLTLADGWRCWQVGEFHPADYLRSGPGSLSLLPVSDALGRAWHAPAVLAPGIEPREGSAVLALPWGIDAQCLPTRLPTPAQATLIAAARSARIEVLAGRLGQIPVPLAAALAKPLIEAVYHLTLEQLLRWQLVDDQLIAGVLLASAGFLRLREA